MLSAQLKNIQDIFNNNLQKNIDSQYILNSILSHCLLLLCSDSIDGESVSTEL